ncbi:MAG: hypothetical protein K0M45_03965 [Candidatus Paracaedibacteraceae bacterium]|nr:hypothetical protein [Candidatus Paracaedibacteraceae bacterium]
MFTKNIKDFKNVSYIFLTLLSIAKASDTASLQNEYINYPVAGGSTEVPYERDIQSSGIDINKDRYTRLKNKIIDKYEKDRPELARFRAPTSRRNGKSALELEKASQEFATHAEHARQRSEQENEDIQKAGETAVNVGHSVVAAVIDNKVSDHAVKKVLLDTLNDAKEGILNFFRK